MKGRAMPASLAAKAERLQIVANTLNNPADRMIAFDFVEDLKALAAREVSPPAISPDAVPAHVRTSMLGAALHRAFPLNHERTFADLISAL
jgi:hypothetical protein